MPYPAPATAKPPKVSIHLPVCNEPPRIVRRTLDALARLDHPDFEVLVVDHNTADPALWEKLAEHCARLGPRFRFFHLGPWPGFRAGALNFALQETAPEAEIIGVLGSRDLVSPDWLRAMVPAFADPSLGFARSAPDDRGKDGTLLQRLMSWESAGSFRPGATTLVRAAALRRARGWAAWSITEAPELDLRLMREGWHSVSVPESFGTGAMPEDFASYRNQRFRWAYGTTGITRAHWRALLSPSCRELSFGQRRGFLAGWLPWLGDAISLLLLLTGLAWSAGLILTPMQIQLPILLVMLLSPALFAVTLAGLLVPGRRRLPERAGAAVARLALSPAAGKAVLWGLLTRRTPLLPTPKMREAPALSQGLAMAREEFCLLVLVWAAIIGVGAGFGLATWETRLWCLILFIQSLPCLAAVAVAILAALPAGGPSLEHGERKAAPVRNRRRRLDRAAGRRAPAGP